MPSDINIEIHQGHLGGSVGWASDVSSGHDHAASGSVLAAQRLEPALDSVSSCLSASPLLTHVLSLSVSLSLSNK